MISTNLHLSYHFFSFLWVKLGEIPEFNSEHAHFLTIMNNGMTFPSLSAMQLPESRPAPASTGALTSKRLLDFFEALRNLIYYRIILVIPGII